jgi:hypothetical protein
MSESRACAGESCLCQVNTATAVHANGKLYCSQRCSEGKGCDHMGCTCGVYPVSVPVLKWRIRPAARRPETADAE